LQAYRLHPAHPHIQGDIGWWAWFDQSWYFSGAKAWAAGNLDPELHLYLPGYSLLGAIFVPVFSVHAYAAVNLLCLLTSLWLFSRIAVRLLPPSLPHAALAGAAVFALAAIGSPAMREVWVVPWSSSGATPFIYAALFATLRFVEAPQRPQRVFWVGLAGGAIAAFRPSDALPIGLACVLGIGITLLRRQPQSLRSAAASIGAGALGLAISCGLFGAAYIAIYGLHESHYVQVSGDIGFEWRSILLRWVTLGLNPRPLYDDGQGIISAFPWLPVGLATFPVYMLLFMRSARWIAHVVVITAASLHMAVYLTYRDLYPEGLFLYENYHYYKWVMPVFALYCLALCCDLFFVSARQRISAVILVLVGLCLLLPWRAQFADSRPIERDATADPLHTLAFHSGLTSVADAILVSASGSWSALYGGTSALTVDGHSYTERLDYKIHPALGGFFVVPLRPLPAGPASLTVDPTVTLDPTVPLIHAQQAIVFGWPCWIPGPRQACTPQFIIPPPALPPSGDIPIGQADQRFVFGAWSAPEPSGRWTGGSTVALRVRPPEGSPLQLDMRLSAFVPPGSEPLRAAISVGSQIIAERTFTDGLPTEWQTTIPAKLVAENAALIVTLTIDNPRRPMDFYPQSRDQRELGLFITSIRLHS
jgi:hypothetical protein